MHIVSHTRHFFRGGISPEFMFSSTFQIFLYVLVVRLHVWWFSCCFLHFPLRWRPDRGQFRGQRQKLLMVTRTQRGLEACAHAQNWKSLITSTLSQSPLRPAMGQLERKCGPYITGMDVRRKWWADCYSSPVCCPLNDSARALVIADRRGVQKPRVTDEVGVGVARGQTPPWCCVCLSGRCLGHLLCLSVELRKLKLITKSTSSSLSWWWSARQSQCLFVVCVWLRVHTVYLIINSVYLKSCYQWVWMEKTSQHITRILWLTHSSEDADYTQSAEEY